MTETAKSRILLGIEGDKKRNDTDNAAAFGSRIFLRIVFITIRRLLTVKLKL